MNIGSAFSGSPYRANGTPSIDMDQLAPDYCISLSRRLCPTTAFDFGVERRCSDFWIVAHASILDVTLISHRNSLLTPSRTFTHLKHHRWSPAENSNTRSPNMIFSPPSLISPRLPLGAKGHLPSGHIVSLLWVLKQFARQIPTGQIMGSFKKYPPQYPVGTL